MAKKAVATFKKGDGRTYSKVIKMVKSPKTGAYIFQEEMIPNEAVKDYFDSGKDLFFCLHSGGYMEYFHTFVWANLQLSDWEQSVNRTYNTLINNK